MAFAYDLRFKNKTWRSAKRSPGPRNNHKRLSQPLIPAELALRKGNHYFAYKNENARLLWRDRAVFCQNLMQCSLQFSTPGAIINTKILLYLNCMSISASCAASIAGASCSVNDHWQSGLHPRPDSHLPAQMSTHSYPEKSGNGHSVWEHDSPLSLAIHMICCFFTYSQKNFKVRHIGLK